MFALIIESNFGGATEIQKEIVVRNLACSLISHSTRTVLPASKTMLDRKLETVGCGKSVSSSGGPCRRLRRWAVSPCGEAPGGIRTGIPEAAALSFPELRARSPGSQGSAWPTESRGGGG
jgi:hypothetical protein